MGTLSTRQSDIGSSDRHFRFDVIRSRLRESGPARRKIVYVWFDIARRFISAVGFSRTLPRPDRRNQTRTSEGGSETATVQKLDQNQLSLLPKLHCANEH